MTHGNGVTWARLYKRLQEHWVDGCNGENNHKRERELHISANRTTSETKRNHFCTTTLFIQSRLLGTGANPRGQTRLVCAKAHSQMFVASVVDCASLSSPSSTTLQRQPIMAAAYPLDTPSRVLKRVQQMEDMELPSLPSFHHDDLDYDSMSAAESSREYGQDTHSEHQSDQEDEQVRLTILLFDRS